MKTITTSKGEFVAASLTTREERGVDCNPMLNLICKLSEAKEGDAKLIVTAHESESINTHLMELHSLLKSKGIDINNGNWYLFKKI